MSRVVVVLEQGAEWPNWIAACCPLPGGSLVVVQEPDEPLAELVRRASQRCGKNARFELALIACNERADEAATAARAALGRMFLALSARVLFAAGAHSSGPCRHRLSELAAQLTAECAGSAVASVRFGTEHGGAPRSVA
jgi:hypothetical protein